MKDLILDVMLIESLIVDIIAVMIVCSRLETIFQGVIIWHISNILIMHCIS